MLPSDQQRAAEKQKCYVQFLQRLRNTTEIFKRSESTSELSEAKSSSKRQFHQSLEKVHNTLKMSNSGSSPEDVVKQRGRDGKMRREDMDDSQPEGKRLKLANEGGNIGKDRGTAVAAAAEEIMPCLGREEPVPEGGGEGKSVSEDL